MTPDLNRTVAILANFAPGLAVSCTAVTSQLETPFQAELRAAHRQRMNSLRLAQFLAGRHCVRDAMAELGSDLSPVLIGPDGEPIWPTGLVGSISHKSRAALAGVARADRYRSIGIDLELVDEVSDDYWLDEVRAPADRLQLPVSSLATALLSAKESYYKAQFPLTRQQLDWHEVSVEGASDGSFQASAVNGIRANGVQVVSGAWIISACTVRTARV
jgi:4'-phosphopantetheinyl transferase EntD